MRSNASDGGPGSEPRPAAILAIVTSVASGAELSELLRALPRHAGLAVVILQAPSANAGLPTLRLAELADAAGMPVVEARAGMTVEANRIHVIPSSGAFGISQGVLTAAPVTGPPDDARRLNPANSFLCALSLDCPRTAFGVALQRDDGDVAAGLRALRAAGGVTFSQPPLEADGGRGAAEDGLSVDVRLAPGAIAREVARLVAHPYVRQGPGWLVLGAEGASRGDGARAEHDEKDSDAADDRVFAELVEQLGLRGQVHFAAYRRSAILLRVARRMALRRVVELVAYVAILKEDDAEVRALADDVLARGGGGFFRDASFFEGLSAHVVPQLTGDRSDRDELRVWVPGCGTGEEPYSLAICLLEHLAQLDRKLTLRLFATDLGVRLVAHARAGLYTRSELALVSPSRLAAYFDPDEGGYRVKTAVREACTFARHDLARDPPFLHVDLVSCRGVLAELSPKAAKKVLATLRDSVGPSGFLALGADGEVDGVRDLFTPVAPARPAEQAAQTEEAEVGGASPRGLFVSSGARRREPAPMKMFEVAMRGPQPRPPATEKPPESDERLLRSAEKILVERYAPPAVLVDDALDVVAYVGRTSELLSPASGRPPSSLLRLVHEDLAPWLHQAVAEARVTSRAVKKAGLSVQRDGVTIWVDLEVVPVAEVPSKARHFLIAFGADAEPNPNERRDDRPPPSSRAAPSAHSVASRSRRGPLRRELDATRAYLRSVVSEHASVQKDLSSANDQLVTSNEELQTTVEELESAKEELQSINEELRTLNDELQNRNADLDAVAADLVNFLESVEVPILMVDHELRIRKFTPRALLVAPLLPSDIGRPLGDLELRLVVPDLPARIRACIADNAPFDADIQTLEGRWLRLRIRPYRRRDQQLDGAVLVFDDVDALTCALSEAERARDFASGIVETVPTPLLVLDSNLFVLSANHAYGACFGAGEGAAPGRAFFAPSEVGGSVPLLRAAVLASVASGKPFRDLEVDRGPEHACRYLSVSGLPVALRSGARAILLAIHDVTAQRTLERERLALLASEREARLEAQHANHAKDLFLATLSHELRSPLNVIAMGAQLISKLSTSAEAKRASDAINRAARNQARLVDDLLDVSRIVSEKLLIERMPVDLASVAHAAAEGARTDAETKGVAFDVAVDELVGVVDGDATRLQQVLANLLTNAIKFTAKGGHIRLSVTRTRVQSGACACISISDDGVGIEPGVLPQLFERFVQAESSRRRSHGGLGLGLAIVRHLVAAHGGTVTAESEGLGRGATFTVTLPLTSPDEGRASSPPAMDAAAAPSIAGVRVLVIDDDGDTRAGVAAMLQVLGAVVQSEPSAEAGLAAVLSFRPEVVLCDVCMPGEDGYGFVRSLRALPPGAGRDTPAAALTALATESDRQDAFAAGFQVHLSKPIDAERLAMAVADLAAANGGPAS